MMKTKAYATVGVILLLLPLASSLIQSVKASSYWSATWHDYIPYSGSPFNRSRTTTVYSPDLNYWVKIALVVSIYGYTTDFDVDSVQFRAALYFDSFADEGLYPVPAEYAAIKIDKSTAGSNLGDQAIEVVDTSDVRPGYSQGGNLFQWSSTSSDYDDREWWGLKALAFGVGLFVEPIDVATDLIDLAYAFAPGEGTDFENAGWSSSDINAICWWHCLGGYFGEANPVRQYALNSIRWLQDWNVEPDTHYGLKVWASVDLPLNNPLGVNYINLSPVTLKIIPSGGGGGCPYISTWNGEEYVVDNNLLGYSEVCNGSDVEDYYRLEQSLVPEKGKYQLQLSEFEQEHSYLDQARLLAVDHESDVNVAVSPTNEILTYRDPHQPVSCVDNHGNDLLESVKAVDDSYYLSIPGDYLILDFGDDLDISDGANLVFRANAEWKKELCIHVQTLNGSSEWVDAAVLRTRENWSTIIVDLSSHLPDHKGELKVRLYYTGIHRLDYVGLDNSKQEDFELRQGTLASAIHSTKGNVKPLLKESDDVYAELTSNQYIQLDFTLPRQTKETRTYMIIVEGYYYTIT